MKHGQGASPGTIRVMRDGWTAGGVTSMGSGLLLPAATQNADTLNQINTGVRQQILQQPDR